MHILQTQTCLCTYRVCAGRKQCYRFNISKL